MASISSQIKLMDVVLAPLANISGALGNVKSSFEAMQSACDNSVDVANFTEARSKVLEASAEVGRVEQKLQNLTSPDIKIPVKWDMQSSATMPSFDTIQPAHDNSVEIANLAEARNKILEVSIEVGKLDDQLQNLASPNIDVPVKWDIQSGTDIFSGTGAERLTNEVQALDDM